MLVINSHLAKKKIRVKKISSNSVFLSTIWNGEVVMGFFDVTTRKITQLTCFRFLDEKEIEELETIVAEYIFGGGQKASNLRLTNRN